MSLLNENEYALIDDYLNGNLPPGETTRIEHRIASDPAFAKEVEWMKGLVELKHRKKAFEVLNTLESIRSERRRRRNLLLALSLVLALVVLIIILVVSSGEPAKEPLNQEPVEQTTEPGLILKTPEADSLSSPEKPSAPPEIKQAPAAKPPPVAERRKPSFNAGDYVQYKSGLQLLGDETAAAEARLLLDQGERTKALPALEKYLASLSAGEEDFDLELEAGKIYLKEMKNYKQAALHFRKVAEGDVIARYKREAQFYLAVTYLAEGKKSDAKQLLQEVAGSSISPWNTQADELFQQL